MRLIPRTLLRSLAALLFLPVAAQAADDVIVVFDASNSMWGQIEGVAKIEIARDVMSDLIDDWDPATNLGLVVYGHRSTDDCSDIETVVPVGLLDAQAYKSEIEALTPRGRTPLTDAVEHAAEELSYRDNPGTVVLISDGIESCERDPCALANLLAEQGIGFTAHVIGFGLGADEDAQTLACIAENTGGLFLSAANADELTTALSEIRDVVAEQPAEPEPEPEPAPEPEPEPAPEVTLTAPPEATVGTTFEVSWTPTIDGADFITIVPLGADEGALGNSVRGNQDTPADLQAPAEPGLYEVRYVLNEGRRTLATVEIEIVEAEVTLTAPEVVRATAEFDVSWSNAINGRDFITIVPFGADEGELGASIRANQDSPGELEAPEEPGLYEIRYVLNEGRRTIAVVEIEVVAADAQLNLGVVLEVPETVGAGETFAVSWTQAEAGGDQRVSLARADQADFSWVGVQSAADGPPLEFEAPAEPGFYEVRFLDIDRRAVLSRAIVEVR